MTEDQRRQWRRALARKNPEMVVGYVGGEPIIRIAGGAPKDNESDDEDEDDDSDEDSGQGGDDDDSDDDGKSGSSDTSPEALAEELARVRKRMEAADRRASAAEAKVREYDDKDKSELEKAQRDLQETLAVVEDLKKTNNELRIRQAVMADSTIKWKDPEDVFAEIGRMDDLELDEKTGEVKNLKQVLRDLAQRKKHWVETDSSKDDDEDDDTSGGGGSTKKSSGNSGSGNRRKGKDDAIDAKALAKKSPHLQRKVRS